MKIKPVGRIEPVRTFRIGLLISLMLVVGGISAVRASVTGVSPNPMGETQIIQDTIWEEENITLGGDLVVQSGYSLTINDCDVLFNATCPEGMMTCGDNTTIIIKDSYIHGKSENERAEGLRLGGSNDTLTIKISSTTFKYLGKDEFPTYSCMVLAGAIYTAESYFRDCSFICDSKPHFFGDGANRIWLFRGAESLANSTPARGIKVERCYFHQGYVGVAHTKYVYDSTKRGCSFCTYGPPHHFIMERCKFYDNPYKPLDFFNASHHGLMRNNYIQNTPICLADNPGASDNLFINNIITAVDSAYLGGKQGRLCIGFGDRNMFFGNLINGGAGSEGLFSCGADWLIAGNRISDCSYGIGFEKYPIPGVMPYKSGGTILGNEIENSTYSGGAITIGSTPTWNSTEGWEKVVIAGNEVKGSSNRGIRILNGEKIVIKKNNINHNTIGIEISAGSTYYNVVANDFSNNTTNLVDNGGPSYSGEFPAAIIIAPVDNNFTASVPVEFQGNGTATGGKSITSYYWFLGDGTTSTEQNLIHTFDSEGEYFVSLIVTDSAGLKDIAIMQGKIDSVWNEDAGDKIWSSFDTTIRVFPNPFWLSSGLKVTLVLYNYKSRPKLRIYNSNSQLIKEFAEFGDAGSDGLLDWDLRDNGGDLVSAGVYTVVIVNSAEEETTESEFIIRGVDPVPSPSPSPSPTTVQNVRVYPNPASDKVNFHFEVTEPIRIEIRIFNISGILVSKMTHRIDASRPIVEWNASRIAAGVYIYKIFREGKSGESGKVSIRKGNRAEN